MDDQDKKLDEEFIPEDGEGNTQSQVSRLKEKLQSAEEKAKEYLDNWQRAQADFVNLRKKDADEAKQREKYAAAGFIKEIIPVIQSMEKAAEHDKDFEPILIQFNSVLKKIGVEQINPIGEMFDPSFHEAIKMVETTDKNDDHKIAEVLEMGYMLYERVIKPARVAVFEAR